MPARTMVPRPNTIINNTFPAFYACYLLKSVQTPDSNSIYIGSTPSPPRRIRQHNGEISAGARKTVAKRPWVMQMIVHGFPSRLAALQFEWAWQHPHRSRHLRVGPTNIFGNRAVRILSKNISIVRTMIALHPFKTWPLHVKLFTEEAVKYWNASSSVNSAYPLPPGFTCTVELEGVDGKSGKPGSGREGPIDITDDAFTTEHLSKNSTLISSGHALACSVCHEPIQNYTSDPLSSALCPTSQCTAVSHLRCLSNAFHEQATHGSAPKTIIPRGGHCASCGQYTLWGDIIRGSFRRAKPSEHPDVDPDDLYVSDEENIDLLMLPERRPSRSRSRSSKRSTQSEQESTNSRVRRSKKDREQSVISVVKDKKSKIKRKEKQRAALSADKHARDSDSGLFVSDSDEESIKIKRPRGRPRKTPSPAPVTRVPVSSPSQPSSKSRVGRPRSHSFLESPPSFLFPVAPVPAITPKRGPGRPPKVKTPLVDSTKAPPDTSAEEQTIPNLLAATSLSTTRATGPSTSYVIPMGAECISPPAKRGRPRKQHLSPDVSTHERSVQQPSPHASKTKTVKTNAPTNIQEPLTTGKGKRKAIPTPAPDTSSGESFDFAGISDIDSDAEMEFFKSPPKRTRGRPKKTPVATPTRKITTLATTGVHSDSTGCWMDLIHKSPVRTLESALGALTLDVSNSTLLASNSRGPEDEVIEISD